MKCATYNTELANKAQNSKPLSQTGNIQNTQLHCNIKYKIGKSSRRAYTKIMINLALIIIIVANDCRSRHDYDGKASDRARDAAGHFPASQTENHTFFAELVGALKCVRIYNFQM